MNRPRFLSSWAVFGLLCAALTTQTRAQSARDTASSVKKADLPQPLALNTLWRVVVNGVDRMTSVPPDERNQFPSEGQMFYIASDPAEPGTTPFYRFYDGANDHRDSTSISLPGYMSEGPNGGAWTNRSLLPGLGPILEGFNASTGDYALMRQGEQLFGYKTQTLQAYGFQRFGNDVESLVPLTRGGITVEANRVYGGSLWHLKWNGVEFLNPAPPGDPSGAPILLFFDVGLGGFGAFEVGDGSSGHGAPLVNLQNQGRRQSSRAIPLADPATLGIDRDHPVIWKNMVFGKDLDLDFNGMGPVVKYAAHLSLPSPIATSTLFQPIMRVQPQFDRFFLYYAAQDALIEVTGLIPDACIDDSGYPVQIDIGGIVVSDDSATHALGVYGADLAHGGSITDYGLKKYPCPGNSYTRLDIFRGGPLPSGDSTYNSYLITETLDNVRQKMHQLFLAGAK